MSSNIAIETIASRRGKSRATNMLGRLDWYMEDMTWSVSIVGKTVTMGFVRHLDGSKL